MGKTIRGFRRGADFQVQYPKGGDSNILQGRNEGRIIRTGVSKKGPYDPLNIVILVLCGIVLQLSLSQK